MYRFAIKDGDASRKVIIASILLGFAVFTGLGIVGVGDDTIAVGLSSMGVGEKAAQTVSRMIFGLFSAGATFLMVLGLIDEHDGMPVSTKDLQQRVKENAHE